MSGTLAGNVALVTGGASGIGRATALAFARAGAAVLVADVSDTDGAETVAQIHALGGNAVYQRCDVASDAEVRALVQATVAHFGRLDHAFNNAGIEGETAYVADCSEENWDRVLSINLKGTWLCMKHEIPAMLRQGGGTIVNTSSISGFIAFRGSPAYVASKHGIAGLTKTAALEYATAGIRINAVCPGVIHSPMIDRYVGEDAQRRAEMVASEPIGRMGTPAEVAEAVLWLSSPAASFVVGSMISVDGGYLCQ